MKAPISLFLLLAFGAAAAALVTTSADRAINGNSVSASAPPLSPTRSSAAASYPFRSQPESKILISARSTATSPSRAKDPAISGTSVAAFSPPANSASRSAAAASSRPRSQPESKLPVSAVSAASSSSLAYDRAISGTSVAASSPAANPTIRSPAAASPPRSATASNSLNADCSAATSSLARSLPAAISDSSTGTSPPPATDCSISGPSTRGSTKMALWGIIIFAMVILAWYFWFSREEQPGLDAGLEDLPVYTTPYTPDYPPLSSSFRSRPSVRRRRSFSLEPFMGYQRSTSCRYRFLCAGADAGVRSEPCRHRTICHTCLTEFRPFTCVLCGLHVDEIRNVF